MSTKPERTGTSFFTRPSLAVRDVPASIAYYCEKLGFEKIWDHPDGQPFIAQVDRDGIELILDAASVIPKPTGSSVITMTLHEEEKLGELQRELEAAGAIIKTPPFEVVWNPGLYQLDVEDPDGNTLVFWGKPG